MPDVELKCPSCQKISKYKEPTKTNTWGGLDYDGCVHSKPNPYYARYIKVCPHCLFCGTRETFRAPPAKDKIEKIAGLIKALSFKKSELQPDQVATLFTTTMSEVVADDKKRADIYLTAAFFLREASWKFPDGYSEIEEIVKKHGLGGTSFLQGKNQAIVDVDKSYAILKLAESEKDDVQKLRLKFVAAIFLRKHGELARASEIIKSIQADRSSDSIIDDCLKTIEKFIPEEKKYLGLAAEFLDKVAEIQAKIRRIEILREIGDTETATKEINRLIEDKQNSQIKKKLEELKKRIERK